MNEQVWDELSDCSNPHALRRRIEKAERRTKQLETALTQIIGTIERICITQVAQLPGDFLDLICQTRQLLKGDPK